MSPDLDKDQTPVVPEVVENSLDVRIVKPSLKGINKKTLSHDGASNDPKFKYKNH